MKKYYSYYSIADENTVLKNPHKGFYFHYVDNGFVRPIYRDEENLEEKLCGFPCMNHLYIRFDWIDVEQTEKCFDWSKIDEIIEKWSSYGFKFSLRLCTYEANNSYPYAFPEWLIDMGMKYNKIISSTGNISYEPIYNDSIYLEKLERLIAEFAKKYDGNPLIEYIDIGTFGTWGEGHTSCGSNTKYDTETLMKHINLHLKYFKKTLIIINDDMITHASHTSTEDAKRLADYCVSKGIGIRDDGICVDYYSETFGYHTLRQPEIFADFTEIAPCDIELTHWERIPDKYMKAGLPYVESLRATKATYTGFHGHVDGWLNNYKHLTDYIANRLGYWYFLCGMEHDRFISGTSEYATFRIENKGFSKAYHRYDLKFYAENENGTYLLNNESPDNRNWAGESVNQVKIKLDFTDVPCGVYKLIAKMTYDNLPIKLGIKEAFKTPDGGYIIDTIELADFSDSL